MRSTFRLLAPAPAPDVHAAAGRVRRRRRLRSRRRSARARMPGDHRHRLGRRRLRPSRRSRRAGAGVGLQDRQEGRHVEDLHGRDRQPATRAGPVAMSSRPAARPPMRRSRCRRCSASSSRSRAASAAAPSCCTTTRRRRSSTATTAAKPRRRRRRRTTCAGSTTPPTRPCRSRTRARAAARSARRAPIRMLDLAHKAHGRMAWKDLMQPGIQLATDGFPISGRLAQAIEGVAHQPARRCRGDSDLPECRPDVEGARHDAEDPGLCRRR